MRKLKLNCRRVMSAILTAALVITALPQLPVLEAQAAFSGSLTSADSVTVSGNVAEVSFNDGAVTAKITFLEDGIFRYNVDPSGEFSEYARTNNASDTAKIPQYPDSSDAYSHPNATAADENGYLVVNSGNTAIKFDKATAKMTVEYHGNVVMQESEPLSLGSKTIQTLVKNGGENFYGGGTQNGRFVHTGETINIANESNWVDGGVASPNPFYYTSEGYGVLRNTFMPGSYDFGKTSAGTVTTVHNENEFDAYYFLSDGKDASEVVQDILNEYYHVTGAPILLPEYAFYEGHLNCYNRDSWSDTSGSKQWTIKGSNSSNGTEGNATAYYESGMSSGYVLKDGMSTESLNGTIPGTALDKYPSVTADYEYSARAVIDQYEEFDMPLGYFLPNDGYGCGYGQNGYYQTGGVNADGSSSAERTAAIDANVQNLADFTEYAQSKGVETGLWTQSNLSPDSNNNTSWHLLRDFAKEVTVGGITTLKTDVAWVGHGYNFALNGLKSAYDIVTDQVSKRPNIITLDGWAGTQRYGAIWTGDQTGGNWEYIRFHVPTYIGQSLSGNPNIGSDMDGIFGGNKIISTRDTQWKVFTPLMLNMDGWGSYAKTPQTFGDPYTGIHRMYLKLKSQLMPYIYTSAASASNIDTGNEDTGLPMIRAMFLEYPEDSYAATKNMQYQYMFGSSILVAPVYTETSEIDAQGNDVRNGIYLPDADQIWIDYFTGDQYRGGQTLNNFDAPIWKLPVFVKNGAIIPMWAENNGALQIEKSERIVEFWPDGNTEYTMYEDDGKTANSTITEEDGYGTVNQVTYGEHVSTKFTSSVTDGTAVLTAEKSTGSYTGYDQDKDTTFIVNVSKEPAAVNAKNGAAELTMVEAESKADFETREAAVGTFVYYYDEAPEIEGYLVDGEEEFAEMMEGKTSSPKLYVKFANTDTTANVQTLILEGFENTDADLSKDELNENLSAPENLRDVAEKKTPTSNTLAWDAVEDATSYEILVDGVVNAVGTATEFTHADQPYNSEHTYQVRSRNAEGYSEWSEEVTAATALDPWRNVPEPETITWTGGDSWGALKNATDHDLGTMFHSTGDVVTDAVPLIFDYGNAYALDKLEYYPRDNYGNGTVNQLDVYTSLDGDHWTLQHEGAADNWIYDSSKSVSENVKTVDLSGVGARYVKLVVKKSVGSFFASNEIAVYKKDGTKEFAVGSTNGLATVAEADYTNMKNYLGFSEKDGTTFAQQIRNRFGDINGNDVYDVYDYAFTMFKLDGGTTKNGAVSGKLLLIPSAERVNAGDTFTIAVYADDVKNLNAFGEVLDYDPAKLQYVSTMADLDIAQMEDLTVNKVYEDETAYVNLAFANRGNQSLYSGTGVIATITMEAKEAVEVTDAIDLSTIMMIGPKFDTVECESLENPELPEITTGGGEYTYGTDFTMTITNDSLTTDDGSNVEKLVQQESFDGLFDGQTSRDFEFKWDIESNYTEKEFPEYVTVPVTLHLDMTDAKDVDTVKVFNANKGNGYVNKAEAVFYYEDGTSEAVAEITADDSNYFAFEFANPKTDAVTRVDVIVTETTPSSNMLTLDEIEVLKDETLLTYGTDFTVTMTNDYLTTDDGTNVNKLIQQETYEGLFNQSQGRDFEFKWYVESNFVSTGKLPEYVKVPATLTAVMDEAKPVASVSVYNANKGNGYVTSVTAVFHYGDNTSSDAETISIGADETKNEFLFENPNADKTVTSVALTVNSTTGISGAGESNKMLTLSEIKFRYDFVNVPVTAIAPAEENVREMYAGSLVDVNAVITPENATNPYFTAVSSNESVARIVILRGEDGFPVYKLYGAGGGKTTVTLTALETAESENPITASYEVEVLAAADKTELVEMIRKCSSMQEKFYTEDSYAKLAAALVNAETVKDKADATSSEVKQAVKALQDVVAGLVELPVEEITDKTGFVADALHSDSNVVSQLLDGQEGTFWESPYYGANAGLPKDVTIDLNGEYDLDKVEIVKHSATNGRVTKYEILVSIDGGESFVSVGDKETEYSELVTGIRFEQKGVTHVKVRVLEANNGSTSVGYARIAEVNFYGSAAVVPADKTALNALIDQYRDLTQGNYTDESWNAFTTALDNAKAVAASEAATQEQVDAQVTALQNAYKGLQEKENQESVDKSALDNAVKTYAGKKQKDYTAESWKRFSDAFEHAKAVLAKENPTQEDVNQALRNLEAAAGALVGVNETPGGGSQGSSSGNTSGGSQTTGTNVATGDSANTVFYTVLLLAAAVLTAAVVYNRRKQER